MANTAGDKITIEVTADPRLTPEQREVVENDYGMVNGSLTLDVRAKLVPTHYRHCI